MGGKPAEQPSLHPSFESNQRLPMAKKRRKKKNICARAERPVTYRPDCSLKMNHAVEHWSAISQTCNEYICPAGRCLLRTRVASDCCLWRALLLADLRCGGQEGPTHSPARWSSQLQAVHHADRSTAGLIQLSSADT